MSKVDFWSIFSGMTQRIIKSYLCYLLLLIGMVSWCKAYGQTDNLEPIRESLITFNDRNQVKIRAYYNNIHETLLKDLDRFPSARVVVLPSFSGCYVLSIEKGQDRPYLLKRSIQIQDGQSLDGIKQSKIMISALLQEKIVALFKIALANTQYPKKPYEGRDGTTYYFVANNRPYKERVGTTWSPVKGSRMADLVEVVELVDKMVETRNTVVGNQIIEKVDQLLERFANEQ